MDFPIKIVIFHSYVSLPEGKHHHFWLKILWFFNQLFAELPRQELLDTIHSEHCIIIVARTGGPWGKWRHSSWETVLEA